MKSIKHFQTMRLFAILLLFLATAGGLVAQKNRREPLTEAQQDKIAEAGVEPNERVALYTKFLNEHSDVLQRLIKRGESGHDQVVDGELQDFTALMDELGSNLDTLGARKADIRKSLKPLSESILRWQQILQSLPSRPAFQVSREDAIYSAKDLADQISQLVTEQKDYFEQHKDEANQERAEPK